MGVFTHVRGRECCLEPQDECAAFSTCKNVMLFLPAVSDPGDALIPFLPQLKFSLESCSRKHDNDVYLPKKAQQTVRANIRSVGW